MFHYFHSILTDNVNVTFLSIIIHQHLVLYIHYTQHYAVTLTQYTIYHNITSQTLHQLPQN